MGAKSHSQDNLPSDLGLSHSQSKSPSPKWEMGVGDCELSQRGAKERVEWAHIRRTRFQPPLICITAVGPREAVHLSEPVLHFSKW